MTTGESIEPLIEQATDWLLRLEEAPGDSSLRAAAESWRAANPAHAQAWVTAERAYRMIARSSPQIRRAPPSPRRWPTARRWGVGAISAFAACLLLLHAPGMLAHLRADVVTETAELRQITLEDGTVIELAPQTRIDVHFSRERRSVTLLSGEAFFNVASQPGRPFDVQVGYRSGRIVFADPSLARQQVTGLYDLRDPDRALRALIGPFGGEVREITPLLRVISGP